MGSRGLCSESRGCAWLRDPGEQARPHPYPKFGHVIAHWESRCGLVTGSACTLQPWILPWILPWIPLWILLPWIPPWIAISCVPRGSGLRPRLLHPQTKPHCSPLNDVLGSGILGSGIYHNDVLGSGILGSGILLYSLCQVHVTAPNADDGTNRLP